MARNKQWKGAAEKRVGGAFRQIPLSVFEGRGYLDCSPYAVKLLFDLLTQYRGSNNGDLTAAWKVMKPRGWRSEATLHKAKQELLSSGLIVETRMGARPNKCSLYALTFFALDENDKLEMTKKSFPQGKYKLKDPTQFVAKTPEQIQLKRVIENASLATAGVVGAS
jgi:muconolactone delta-isomerase